MGFIFRRGVAHYWKDYFMTGSIRILWYFHLIPFHKDSQKKQLAFFQAYLKNSKCSIPKIVKVCSRISISTREISKPEQ